MSSSNLSPDDLPLDQVLQGDCIQVLAGLPAESVDLVFADPPYNLQLHQDLLRPNRTRVDAVNDAWDQFENFQAYDQFTLQWLAACRRVLKKTGALWVIGTYHNIYRVGSRLQDLGFWILNDVVWVKDNPMPNFRGVRFTNAHEMLIWAQKDRGTAYTFNYQAMKSLNEELQMRSDWYLPICTGPERLRLNGEKAHSTQKPEALLYRILLASTNPGDVVLDPFFGTGTSGAVAKRLHRHWIGIERQVEYVELARKRIGAIQPAPYDPTLFEIPDRRRLLREGRLPFGKLLEYGLLQPGATLYLGVEEQKCARVLVDGSLEYEGQRGSIHQMARLATGTPATPCNGWEQWYYVDLATAERWPINRLRDRLRAKLQAGDTAADGSENQKKDERRL
jgi:modification methylase